MMLGLISRADVIALSDVNILYAGDVLWAQMVYWLIRALFPYFKLHVSTLLALCFTYGIEFSQLYQGAWLNDIRSTLIGGLVLGFGFMFSDLACYSVGIFIGYMLDRYVFLNYFLAYEKN